MKDIFHLNDQLLTIFKLLSNSFEDLVESLAMEKNWGVVSEKFHAFLKTFCLSH